MINVGELEYNFPKSSVWNASSLVSVSVIPSGNKWVCVSAITGANSTTGGQYFPREEHILSTA